MTPSPFEVGSYIREVALTFTTPDGVTHASNAPRRVAKIVDVDEEGFHYEYPRFVPMIARLGLGITAGHCYPAGYHTWERATEAEYLAFEASLAAPLTFTQTST